MSPPPEIPGKSSAELSDAPFSFSFATDGLDRRLLPTLSVYNEWKAQSRISSPNPTPSSSRSPSPAPPRPRPTTLRADLKPMTTKKLRSSSLSRFFHHNTSASKKGDELVQVTGGSESLRRLSAGSRTSESESESVGRRPSVGGSEGSLEGRPMSGSEGSADEALDVDDASILNHSGLHLTSSPELIDSIVPEERETPVASPLPTATYFDPHPPLTRNTTTTSPRRSQSAEGARSPAPLYEPSFASSSSFESVAGPEPAPRSDGAPSTEPLASPSITRRPRRPSLTRRPTRSRSMHEMGAALPTYDVVEQASTSHHLYPVLPREDEGREGLPGYSCAIHLSGYFPVKFELSSPRIPARDRAWKRVFICLRGTSLKIYKNDLRTHPIAGEEDDDVWTCDGAQLAPAPPVHFHPGEYGTHGSLLPAQLSNALDAFPISLGDARDKLLSRHSKHPDNVLLREYSLQNAESGVAADYYSREFVVRLRAEGEQLLLQAQDDRSVVDLVEALQAATNVALDLDDRPLPTLITIPRRRRRLDGTFEPAPEHVRNILRPFEGQMVRGVPRSRANPIGA